MDFKIFEGDCLILENVKDFIEKVVLIGGDCYIDKVLKLVNERLFIVEVGMRVNKSDIKKVC